MECPYCGIEMKKGVIQSAREIYWSNKKGNLFFMPLEYNGDVKVAPFGWNGSSTEAYICNNCKKLIVNLNIS